MKLEYEDRGDGYYRCVDCELAFDPAFPSAAQDASNCCAYAKAERRTWRWRLKRLLGVTDDES